LGIVQRTVMLLWHIGPYQPKQDLAGAEKPCPDREDSVNLRLKQQTQYFLRRFDGKIFSSARYFATVRRAITTFFSFNIFTI